MAAVLNTKVVWDEVWEQVVTPAINETMRPFRDAKAEVPSRLLHFTSASALLSILKSRTLRLTRALSSNDPEETAYGLSLARPLAREVLDARNQWDAMLGQQLFDSFAGRMFGSKHALPDPHVCCFSRPDVEHQAETWALYGRTGSGFALVFDGQELANTRLTDLVPVLYDAKTQQEHLRALIGKAQTTCAAARELARPYGTDLVAKIHLFVAHAFGSLIAVHAATMKRDAFQFEKEWRFLVHSLPVEPEDVESLAYGVEAIGPIVRSYYEAPFKPTALKEIVVGKTHASLNLPVVEAMRSKFQLEHVDVREGNIALRTFS